MRHKKTLAIAWFLVAGLSTSCTHSKQIHHDHRHKNTVHHDFSDSKKWSKIFDNPERDKWQKPQEVVRLMDVKAGMRVADIGAGTGYFLPYLKDVAGNSGLVFALDLPDSLIQHMNDRALKSGWRNVYARKVRPDDPLLADESVDRVLIVDTWHHIENRVDYTKKILKSLKPGGALYIVDFNPDSERGPKKKHKIESAKVLATLKAAGMEAELLEETLPDQYIVKGLKL